MMDHFRVNAVAFREDGVWVAQGIEYDIVATASEVTELPDAFCRAVMENILITQHLGRKPLEGVKAAPDHFVQMFEAAGLEMRPTQRTTPADVSVRVAA